MKLNRTEKALEDMKWEKEMEEQVQEILESVKACEKDRRNDERRE